VVVVLDVVDDDVPGELVSGELVLGDVESSVVAGGDDSGVVGVVGVAAA
jgi:hypothetical protein